MRAVVLDRDGVINDNSRMVHVHQPEELILFPKVCDAIQTLNEHDYGVFIATNQGGVGLGFLSQDELDGIHKEMIAQLQHGGARIDGIAACTHAPRAGCSCRKPKPGMLRELQRQYGFSMKTSYMVGDRDTDVQAGLAAGMKTIKIGEPSTQATFSAPSLYEAVQFIIQEG